MWCVNETSVYFSCLNHQQSTTVLNFKSVCYVILFRNVLGENAKNSLFPICVRVSSIDLLWNTNTITSVINKSIQTTSTIQTFKNVMQLYKSKIFLGRIHIAWFKSTQFVIFFINILKFLTVPEIPALNDNVCNSATHICHSSDKTNLFAKIKTLYLDKTLYK